MTVDIERRRVIGSIVLGALVPHKLLAQQAKTSPAALMVAMNAIELAPRWEADGRVAITRGGRTQERGVAIAAMRQGQAVLGIRRYRFVAPADIRNTALLVRENQGADNDLWLLLPALGRVRRITSSRLDGSFAGTDFTYADLMPMQLDRYNHVLLRDEGIGGVAYAVIESRPIMREYAASIGYGAIRTWIRRTNAFPTRVEYDDPRGRHVKTQLIGDPRAAANGKHIMGERRMRRTDNSSETLIRLRNVRFDSAISGADFTPQRLEAF